MNVLSPIWLIGLAPWLALALWILRGQGELRRVPFLRLWSGAVAAPKASRKQQLPPVAIVAILIALLVGVIAAGRLAIGRRQQVTVNLIVDRGSRMSAQAQIPRYLSRTYAVLDELEKRWPRSRVTLIPVPGTPQPDLSIDACRRAVGDLSSTPFETTALLASAMSARRPNTVVVGNQSGDSFNDIGIVSLALATQPHLQLMVRLQNFSAQTSVNLQITTAGVTIEKIVPLPPRGSTQNSFVDLNRVGDAISVSFVWRDDNPLNDYAYLIRETARREPDPRTQLSPSQQRVIAVYQRNRPSPANAERLPVVDRADALVGADAGIIVAKPSGSISSSSQSVIAHPITENVDWRSLPKEVEVVAAPEGWTPLVSLGSNACVAINPQHPRQVWVGIDSPSWSSTKDFVIFWTNVLDYASSGSETWAAHPITEWTPEWKSPSLENGVEVGVYERSDGVKRAFNACEIPAQPTLEEPWDRQMDRLKPDSAAGEIAPALLLAALGLIVLFAIRY